MSAERDETRIVRSWLEEGVTTLPDRVLDAVLDQLPATPQRRAGWLARRVPLMDRFIAVRVAAAAAAVVVVAMLGYALILRPGIGDDVRPSASPVPSATPELAVFRGGAYESARYFIAGGGLAYDWLGLDVSVQVPQGWARGDPHKGDLGIAYLSPSDETGIPIMELQFWLVDNVTDDGCDAEWPPAQGVPPVGPTVDDLASALTSLPEVETTTPVDVTLDGWDGKRLDLRFPEGFCGPELFAWSMMPDPSWTMGAGDPGTHQLWILDVDGTRLVVDAAYDAGTSAELQAELRQIVDSMEIDVRAGG